MTVAQRNAEGARLSYDPNLPWIGFRTTRPQARRRLIAFPSAGGGASMYSGWTRVLPQDIDLLAVRLPGREIRIGEPRLESAVEIANRAAAQLMDVVELPFALFGHSMGALIAYLVAQRLVAAGRAPSHLFVSASPAPHLPRRRQLHLLDDEALTCELAALDGVPEALLRQSGILEMFLPAVRSDLKAYERWKYETMPRLPCPIHAFGGSEDTTVSREELSHWEAHTAAGFGLSEFTGGHFYLKPLADELLAQIDGLLGGHQGT